MIQSNPAPLTRISIVALLPTFEQVIIDTGEFPGDLACPHIVAIEKAADTRVFRRGVPITDEQRRYGAKATVIEAIHTGIPPCRVCQ
jgi:hypothetical protein